MEEQIYQKEKKMEVYEFANGVVLPRKFKENGPLWGLGGVCNAKGVFEDVSVYDGGWTKQGGNYGWEKQEEEFIDEEVVYIGLFFSHWGHFLIDLTGRMWYLCTLLKQNSKIKIAYIGEEEPKGSYLDFFKMLGVEKERLVRIMKPTRFRKVLVPEMSFRGCIWYTKEFQDMFDLMVQEAIKDEGLQKKYKSIKKVYFTRRNFLKAKKTEFGELYFEKCFVENGYKAIAPETLSLKEQIYIWNCTESVACLNGSILLNVVFSKNANLDLVVLNKMSLYHKNPYILLKMRGITATFLDVYKEPLKSYPKSLGEGPYLLHVSDDFREFCKNRGFIVPFAGIKLGLYETWQEIQYFVCVLNILNRIKRLVFKVV